MSVLPRRKSGPGKASSLARNLGRVRLRQRQVARRDDDDAVGAEAAGGGERNVLAQTAVAIELGTDAYGGKEHRDGGGGERVDRLQQHLFAEHGRVGRPAVGERIFLRDEDDGAPGADVRGGDGDGAEDAGVEVLLNAREGDGVGDQLLNRGRVDEADAVLRVGADVRRTSDERAHEAEQLAAIDREHLIDGEVRPDVDEAAGARARIVGEGGQAAGVERTDRGAAQDVERRVVAEMRATSSRMCWTTPTS